MESLGFSTRKMISFVKRGNFTSSFPFQMTIISFSFLIAMPRPFYSMLNRGSESGHSSFILNLGGKIFSLLPLNVMFAVSFSHTLFIMLRQVTSIPSLFSVFMMNIC